MAKIPCLTLNTDAIRDSIRGASQATIALTGIGIGVPPWDGRIDWNAAIRALGANGAVVSQNLVFLGIEAAKQLQKLANAVNLLGPELNRIDALVSALRGVSPIAYDPATGEISHEAVGTTETTEASRTGKVLAKLHLTAVGQTKVPVDADFVALPAPTPHYHLATAQADYNCTDLDHPTVLASIDGVVGNKTVALLFRGTHAKSIEYPNIRQYEKFLAFSDAAGTDWYCTGPHDAPINGPGMLKLTLLDTDTAANIPLGWEKVNWQTDPENPLYGRFLKLALTPGDPPTLGGEGGGVPGSHKHPLNALGVQQGEGAWVNVAAPGYTGFAEANILSVEIALLRRVL